MVGRDDGDEVHALLGGQGGLALDPFLVGAVTAAGRQEEVAAAGAGAFGVGGERAADEFNLAVHVGRDAMDAADERAATAADHAVTNFSAHEF